MPIEKKKKKGSESGKGSSGIETEKLDSVQVKVKAITSIGKKESRTSHVALSPQITNLPEKDKGSSSTTTSKKTLNAKSTKFVADSSSSGSNGKKLTSSSPVETRSAYRRKLASPAVSGSTGGKKLATGRKKQDSSTAESKKKLLDISKRKPSTNTEKKQGLATASTATDKSLGSTTANSLVCIKRRSRRFINSIDATREHCTSETIIGMVFCSSGLASYTTQQDHQTNNNNNNNNSNVVIIAKKEESDTKNQTKLASTESDSHELSNTKTVSSSNHHGLYSMHLNADEAIKTIVKLLQENYITGDINAAQMEAIKDKAINKVKIIDLQIF